MTDKKPREVLSIIPSLVFGKAEAEWVLPMYLYLAHQRNTWTIPFADIIYMMARKPRTANPKTWLQKTMAWIRRNITHRVPKILNRNFEEGIRVIHVRIF